MSNLDPIVSKSLNRIPSHHSMNTSLGNVKHLLDRRENIPGVHPIEVDVLMTNPDPEIRESSSSSSSCSSFDLLASAPRTDFFAALAKGNEVSPTRPSAFRMRFQETG